ncbi:DUF5333 family protein [Chachezhania sediminis]|uniref:DUF5333 family protein n=1 Tax=Chachezhania sediminis TaxID=2599291 RepID=UPI00131DC9D7|nr:DUF5333 family protein [Chachezhania sediminis]
MALSSRFGALTLLAMAAACTPRPPAIMPAEGATAKQAVDSFMRTVAIADGLAEACADYGVLPAYKDPVQLTQDYVVKLEGLGYDPAELAAAATMPSPGTQLKWEIGYVNARGASLGDRVSVCALAQSEIEKGTPVGSLLRMG